MDLVYKDEGGDLEEDTSIEENPFMVEKALVTEPNLMEEDFSHDSYDL